MFAINVQTFAQEDGNTDGGEGFGDFDFADGLDTESALNAFLGYSKIGDQNFIGMRIRPDFSFGKLGIGMNIPLMFNLETGKFRTDEFKDGVGLLRMIDYLRWGVKKRDPVYIKVGTMTDEWIGYGMLLDNYTNAYSYDKRKIGVSFDILVKNFFGLEGLYSDFDMSSFNLLALRPYIKPFGSTKIPIIKTMDIGFTYVTDNDNTQIGGEKQNLYIEAGQKAWAADIGVMPLNRSFMQLKVYAQYGELLKNESELLKDTLNKLADILRATGQDSDHPLIKGNDVAGENNYDSGNGFSVGADFRFNFGAKTIQLRARIERLWFTEFFSPQFYDGDYEANKDTKLIELANTDGKKGIYGSLTAVALEKVLVGGALMIPDNVSETAPATLALHFDASKMFEKFEIRGQYVKGGLTNLGDAFKFDERSLASVRVAYKMYRFILAGIDYRWTWSEQSDGEFKVGNYISPYVGFSMPLSFGSGNDPIDFDD
ncbi:MAG: hypothetical protein B6I20_10180 [Bacteroidetes bacterium 4572_117]|nr:MAG: hypothetical protein B6I20_10180 [Bacteroidetes bacterium 4572_117]